MEKIKEHRYIAVGVLLGTWLVFASGILYLMNGSLKAQTSERIFYPHAGFLDTPQGPMMGLAVLVVLALVMATCYILSVISKIYRKWQ